MYLSLREEIALCFLEGCFNLGLFSLGILGNHFLNMTL